MVTINQTGVGRRVVWADCPMCGVPQPRYENSSYEVRLCYECALVYSRTHLPQLEAEHDPFVSPMTESTNVKMTGKVGGQIQQPPIGDDDDHTS